MNREIIEPGRSKTKLGETFAIIGGFGALLYPLVFYYVGAIAILDRNDFLECKAKEESAHKAKNESFSDNVRFTITWNCFMIIGYLVCHYNLFARPEDKSIFTNFSVAFPIMLIAEIVFALINFILIGTSICNDGAHGVAAILSSLAILIINGATLAGGIVYFLAKTRTPAS